MLRRLVVIGDIHTEATRLAHVLEHAAQSKPDAVLSVGDIVDGPEDSARCIELLRDHGVLAVRGNHERWLLAGSMRCDPFEGPAWCLEWLAQLPATRRFDTPAGPLLLGHGIGASDMPRLYPDETDEGLEFHDALWELVNARDIQICIGGHTHQRMLRRFDHFLFMNPGTLARADEPGFLEIDLESGLGRWYWVDLDGVERGEKVNLAKVPVEPSRPVAPGNLSRSW
jgi:predicted phosphodiesterase